LDTSHNNILYTTFEKNNTDLILLLLDYITNIDILNEPLNKNSKGAMTPLCIASYNGNLIVCEYLIECFNCSIEGYETDVEEWDYDGEELIDSWYGNIGATPLVNAVYSGNYKLVKYLLKNDANVNNWSFNTPCTQYKEISPLCMAVMRNHYKIAKLLVMSGANPDEIFTKAIYHEFYTEHKNSVSAIQLVLDDLKNKMRFLKLFKMYTKSITHKQYIFIRNKFRENNDIKITMIPVSYNNKLNKFSITEIKRTVV
jgi:hypothetical protein